MKNLLLTSLIICSLSGCSSVEYIHSPVGCEGQPKVSLMLTQEEYDRLDDSTAVKISILIKTLRKRIDTQCEINQVHDEQYK